MVVEEWVGMRHHLGEEVVSFVQRLSSLFMSFKTDDVSNALTSSLLSLF
jgi:hypothetical protein